MKFIRFNDSKVDTSLFLQLQDLSTVLSGIPDLEFEYNYERLSMSLTKKLQRVIFGTMEIKMLKYQD